MTAVRLSGVRLAAAAILLLAAAAVLVAWLNVRGEQPLASDAAPFAPTPALVARGAYLARVGNCAACHTERGGAAYAGGKGIATPFGTVFASNLTPDTATGIGAWTAAQFWRALHNGRSADGRLLYPAFPYPSFTEVTRADSDALYAWLRTVAPVRQADRPHQLRFPYGLQASLAVWRALFFAPGVYEPVVERTAQWNRGAYLVRSLGHCAACHSPRNAFGATRGLELSGGLIPMQDWYAPSLAARTEAGVADWPPQEVAALLRGGMSPHGATLGPMADVVAGSTRHLDDADLAAMVEFLRSLPQAAPAPAAAAQRPDAGVRARGQALYKQSCASCHGDAGEGGTSGGAIVCAPLAGNRKVLLESPTNLIRIIVNGGFPPTTHANPRPFGMPPFGPSLKDDEIAALASYVRSAWGNAAPAVSAVDVLGAR